MPFGFCGVCQRDRRARGQATHNLEELGLEVLAFDDVDYGGIDIEAELLTRAR